MKVNFFAITSLALVSTTIAGPITWGLCQTACNAGYATCCIADGSVAGTFTLGIGIPAALAGCSVIQGACMVACSPIMVAPTP